MNNDESTSKVESPADFGTDPAGLAKRWITAIKLAKKARKEWCQRGDKIIARYRDERPVEGSSNKFNILWSNVQTLKPSLYAQTPKPLVSRRFKDKDPIGRRAAQVLERAADFALDEYDFDSVMEGAVEDRLLPGLGVARVDYEPFYADKEVEGETVREVAYERAPCKYWHWKDFLHGPARQWQEVPWVAYRSFLTRSQLVKRFGDIGNQIPLDYKPDLDDEDLSEEFKKAEVWEIWDKESKKVIWLSLSFSLRPLDYKDPHLKLAGFFPSPKPLFATTTTDKLIPVPDYAEYQDQAKELDTITARIDKLVEALRVNGVRDASAEGLDQLLSTAHENELVPVENWAAFAQKGGMDSVIAWLPIEQIAKVLEGLYEAREQVKQTLYEITGLSDIVRGASDPRETLGAQQLKGQYVNRRLKRQQAHVAKFARDLIQLKIEVMAEHFSAQTLKLMTGIEVTPEVEALLRNDPVRTFRIDIETDSTLQPDEQADKEARIEFLSAVSSFMTTAVESTQQIPELAPLLGEMLLFGVRGFRVGREIEEVIESAVEGDGNSLPAPDNGEAMKAQEAQGRLQADQARLQLDGQKMQGDFALKQRELGQKDRELDIREIETRAKIGEAQPSEEVQEPEGPTQAELVAQQALEAVQQLAESIAQMQADRERTQALIFGHIEQHGSPRMKQIASELMN